MKIEIIQKGNNILIRKKSFFGLFSSFLFCHRNPLALYSSFCWFHSIDDAHTFASVEDAKKALTNYESSVRHHNAYISELRAKQQMPIKVLEKLNIDA